MSYTREIKAELMRVAEINPAELAAFVMLRGQVIRTNAGYLSVNIPVNQPAMARRVYRLWKNLYPSVQPRVLVKRNRTNGGSIFARVAVSFSETEHDAVVALGRLSSFNRFAVLSKYNDEERKAWIRGAFISRGFIHNPQEEYHLEITLLPENGVEEVAAMLNLYHLDAKLSLYKASPLVYIKKGEKIADFLRLVGAGKALADLENLRIIKSLKNNVNRQVNCETANLSKTVNASLRQSELLETFIAQYGWKKIPGRWRELAELRLDFKHSSLQELGNMLEKPLTKSGVAHRMKKLEEYINDAMQKNDCSSRERVNGSYER